MPEKGGEVVWKPFSRRILINALVSEEVSLYRLSSHRQSKVGRRDDEVEEWMISCR